MNARNEYGAVDELVVLPGGASIQDFIQLYKARAADGYRLDDAELVHRWRKARKRIRELESTEAAICDNPVFAELPESMAEFAARELQTPEAQQSFHLLPHRWAMVEIDRLIVMQNLVNLRFVAQLRSLLAPAPFATDIIRLATGRLQPQAEVRVTRLSETVYSFSSPSSDFRFLDTKVLEPHLVQGSHASGRAALSIGVFIGFGVNFITALHVKNRLILLNGTHRLYALREMGVTHAPCLIRSLASTDELALAEAEDINKNAQLYIHSQRPPLFKDYFDDGLRTITATPRSNRVLHLQIVQQQWRIPVT
jgi:hypothetical protein